MKKRIVSMLLVLCTLLPLFPIASVAAETVLPKDESQGTGEPVVEGTAMTAYDALYVGADGSKTANGGKLIGLYTAYGEDTATVTLSKETTAGSWKNKMDNTGATDAVLRDTCSGTDWVLGEGGGIGYHITAEKYNTVVNSIGLTLPVISEKSTVRLARFIALFSFW